MPIENTRITRENFDDILRKLGKHFRKLNGKAMPAEIVLVGGAAIMASYGFRNMTNDMDAIIHASSALQDAAAIVEEEFGLEHNWLNSDFRRTNSFSAKLVEHSKYYRTFANVLQVRVVDAEYLLAMKLVAGRDNKNDLTDIVGIIAEQIEKNDALTYERIDCAMVELYGGWERIPNRMKDFLEFVLAYEEPTELYEQMKAERDGNITMRDLEEIDEVDFLVDLEEEISDEEFKESRKFEVEDELEI